jgi:hypothetical protein
VIRHEIGDVVARDKQFRVQMISAVERKLVVLSYLALRIKEALNGLTDGLELARGCEQSNRVSKR